jgi:hypothetical protein
MPKTHGLARTDHHMFFLTDEGTQPGYLVPTNGLIAVDVGIAVIFTGVHMGVVDLEVDGRESRPTDVPADGWDEVVETSVNLPSGRLAVSHLMNDPPDLPIFTAAGPGHYRVRVHARGRDTMPDGVAFEPVEAYQITVWPEPYGAEVVYRQSDGYGASLRRSAPAASRRAARKVPDDHRLRLQKEALRRAGGIAKRSTREGR